MYCGIYKITNIENGKCYIGKSNNILRRWMEHQHKLQRGTHHSMSLQNDWNKYGITKFTFQVICECEENKLDDMEEKYSFMYDSLNKEHGYNEQTIGDNTYLKNFIDNRLIPSEKYLVNIQYLVKYTFTPSYLSNSALAYIANL